MVEGVTWWGTLSLLPIHPHNQLEMDSVAARGLVSHDIKKVFVYNDGIDFNFGPP